MLTQHTYFNKIWNHTLHLPYSHCSLAIDGNALPTGEIVNIYPGTPSSISGPCHVSSGNSYNGEWLVDSNTLKDDVVVKLSSNWNGIGGELRTNQAGIVLYTWTGRF